MMRLCQAAKIGIFAARENRRVLDRNARLIGVAIERPSLELAAREFAFVHEQMKRMLVVIAFFADGAKLRDEFGFGDERGGFRLTRRLRLAHRLISIPS
jgi:hypothetical protein